MRKLIFLFFVFISINAFSQTDSSLVKVTLKSGAVYTGQILLKNDELIMFKDKDGARFQFQLNEISTVVTYNPSAEGDENSNQISGASENLCGIIEAGYGVANARKLAEQQSITQFSICFGNKRVMGKDLFVGIGAGYFIPFDSKNAIVPTLVPVFLKVQFSNGKKNTSLIYGIESGYTFSVNQTQKGGLFSTLSAGLRFELNKKTALFANAYGTVFSIKSYLTDSGLSGSFVYYGSTTMNTVGVKAGLRF